MLEGLTIKDMTLKNPLIMAPMCMYMADQDGQVKEFHLQHYVSRAIGGTGLVLLEATAILPNGRISDGDLGIWEDEQVAGLQELVRRVHDAGSKIGIQLAHAGRKCLVPNSRVLAPSPLAYNEEYPLPEEMTLADIKEVLAAFSAAAHRANLAGFDFIELHGAHGYLVHEFLSPLSNKRTDAYGQPHVFLQEALEAIRKEWPLHKPLGLRISATDYLPGGLTPASFEKIWQDIEPSSLDVINVSSGGVLPATIKSFPGYQLDLAREIMTITNLPVMGGGLLTSKDEILEALKTLPLVYLGRALLRNPYLPHLLRRELGLPYEGPKAYERAF